MVKTMVAQANITVYLPNHLELRAVELATKEDSEDSNTYCPEKLMSPHNSSQASPPDGWEI